MIVARLMQEGYVRFRAMFPFFIRKSFPFGLSFRTNACCCFSDLYLIFIFGLLQGTSTFGRMVPKSPTAMTSSIFDEDDASLMEMPWFPKVALKRLGPRDDGSKKRKQTSSHLEKAKRASQKGHDKEADLTKCSDGRGLETGKSRFYQGAVRLTPSLTKGLLLGHDPLILGAKEGDYGEPRFYSGLSSSGKTDLAREESY
jgi:hypothetical protein